MSTPKQKSGRGRPDSPEQEEANLLAVITAGLDCREKPRYQAVDEFAPEFLLQFDAAPTRRGDTPR